MYSQISASVSEETSSLKDSNQIFFWIICPQWKLSENKQQEREIDYKRIPKWSQKCIFLSAEQAEALGQTPKGSQVQLMFFLALSPTQVALLSQYPGLLLHSNMLLTTCPFYPLWIHTHCKQYLKQSKYRIIKGKQEQKTSTSALITPHICFPHRDLENLLHTLDCSHHPCLCGPRISAHLPDQAQ